MVKFKTNCQGVWCPHKEGAEQEERRGARERGERWKVGGKERGNDFFLEWEF